MTYFDPGITSSSRLSRLEISSLEMSCLECTRNYFVIELLSPAKTFTPEKPYFEEVVNLRSIVGLINLFLHFCEPVVICNMDTLYNTTILVDIYTFLEEKTSI